MINTTIAANIKPGGDGKFGTADDESVSSGLEGGIASIKVTTSGGLSGSGNSSENFGIVAHKKIARATVGTTTKYSPLNWAFGNRLIKDNIA